MRGLRQDGKQRGSALHLHGKSHHRQRGLGVRHLLRLLVLLASQQVVTMVDGRILSRFILQPAAVVVGTLLAPQAAQAQAVSTVLTATAGVNKVTLTWVATNVGATRSTGNTACPNYPFNRWEYRQKAGSSNYGGWTSLSTTHTTRSHEVTGLTAGTVYKFQVRPVWACVSPVTTALTTGTSNEDTATPMATTTSAPTGFTATAGNAQVTLSWDDPDDDTITGYEYQRKKGSSGAWSSWVDIDGSDADTVTHTFTGLDNGVVYRYRIRAVNAAGEGARSVARRVTPTTGTAKTMTLRSDQANNRISEGNSGTKDVVLTVTLSEAAPAGGLHVTIRFAIRGVTATGSQKADNFCEAPLSPADTDWCFPSSARGATILVAEGRTKGSVTVKIIGDTRNESDETIGFVTYTALDGWTNAPPLTLSIVNDDGTTPAARPTWFSAAAGDRQVRLSWADPEDATITGYKVRYGKKNERDSSTWSAAISNSDAETTSHTVTGLENDAEYSFQVRAVSSTVDGVATDWVDATPIVLPGVTVSGSPLTVAEGGSGAYTVKLDTAPTADVTITVAGESGDVTVTGSPLTFSTQNYGTAQTVTVNAGEDGDTANDSATLTHSAASSDNSYGSSLTIQDVSVSVTDNDTPTGGSGSGSGGGGGSTPSEEEEEEELPSVPSQPTGLTAQAGNAQVTLSWSGPTDATISKWQYQQKQGNGSYGPWRDVPNANASTRTYTVTGLSNGTAYSFRIRAVNAGGNSPASAAVMATPVDPDTGQADKARSQASAATSRTLLGMATDVLGSRTDPDAPTPAGSDGDSMGEQAMGIVEEVLGINGGELPTALTLEEVEDRLWSHSFQLTPSAKGNDGQQEWTPSVVQQRSWALWGAGELRSYRSEEKAEGLSSSGNVKTAWLGVDHPFTDRWLAGLALSFSSAESDYSYRKTDGSTDGGKMSTRLTTFYPYGSFQVSEGLRLWGVVGMGRGSQQHRQTGDDTTAEGDLRLQMGVIGFERALSPVGKLNLSLAGDAGLVKSTTDWKAGSGLDDLSVSLHRIRMGIDSSFPLTAHTTGYLNLKGRLDGGDLEMTATEIVAGLHYGKERFSGFLQGRQTYAFDGSYAESALTAQLRFTSRPDGTGLAWELQPSYGARDGDMALSAGGPSLWTDEQLEALTGSNPSQQSGETALSSRVGYGIRLQPSDLLLTPFTEMRFSEAGSQHIGLGLSLEGNSWNLELSGSTENTTNASPTTKGQLTFSKRL